MMKQLLTGIAVAVLSASAAYAADAPAPKAAPAGAEAPEMMPEGGPGGMSGHRRFTAPKTRQEAIERLEKRLEKLKSMSDADWQKQHDERMARYKNRRQHRGDMAPSSGKAPEPQKQ